MNDDAQTLKTRSTTRFNTIAAGYDQHGAFAHFGQRLVAAVGIEPGQRVLDVATGPGAVLFAATERVGRAGEAVGVDLAENMVRAANEEAERRGLGARVRAMDAEQFDLPDASFDRLLCGFGVMFFPDLGQALSEFRRVLSLVVDSASPRDGYSWPRTSASFSATWACWDTMSRTGQAGSWSLMSWHVLWWGLALPTFELLQTITPCATPISSTTGKASVATRARQAGGLPRSTPPRASVPRPPWPSGSKPMSRRMTSTSWRRPFWRSRGASTPTKPGSDLGHTRCEGEPQGGDKILVVDDGD